MKRKPIQEKKNRINATGKALLGVFLLFCLALLPAQAAEEVTAKINSLYELVLNIITAAGVIVLAWGIFEFATAYQQHDTSQQTMSLKKVISGFIMIAAPTIINLLK